MNTPVFKDKNLQARLDKHGFVKVPFWDAGTLKLAHEKFESDYRSRHRSAKHFHTTYETTNIELINDVRTFLQPLFLKITKGLFEAMAPVSAGYLIKESNPDSASPLHQDASFVDEPEHCSVSVWVALEDIGVDKGCLQFLPGSHRLFNSVRSIPYSNKHIENYSAMLQPYITNHTIKAGEAFIFYNAILHTSPANKTHADRVTTVMGFYNQAAQLSLYLKNEPAQCIDRYAITRDQLTEINATFKPRPEQFISSHPLPQPLKVQDVKAFIRNNYPYTKQLKVFFARVV